ncbi:ABC transporter ATP-binding protein [Actinoplanes sp. NBRC 14428]|uniref:Iron(III) transport system ATP-binding protein n=1 Tax=Pseudosporangium ferrugineum TaxID=439699 RepID=A0A2T0SEX2_9ACTN|nr:ABC transporter ATP-binding protein [Pseudosporangium ferrugineum]PRY31893.1 iron(III) transport system ATP-binding protein [Pseudosporangium ferrugineum]BCJ49871.1 ABC transporter ATP-binding protein [Actinoplanes sp. NBRC 14428]
MTMTHAPGELTPPKDRAEAGALRLDRLTKTFTSRSASVTAVDDVSLDVRPGEFITLLGPSGCGKTTTLRIVAGFETATSGGIQLDGAPIDRTPPQRRAMAMVFQSYALFPHLTVGENIAYGLKLRRRPHDDVRTAMQIALTSMNLVGLENRSPHELSGGQQQRVALARALIMQPKVLLFDEPLSNLDAKLRGAMRAEIRRIQRRLGITSLYVTHDQDEAMSMSDRIVVMNKGRVEQVAAPARIYFRPATIFVADFIGRANFIEVAPEDVGDGSAVVHALGNRLTVPAHPAVRAGGAGAYLMIRPETISLEPAAEGGIGTVLRSTFHGHSVDYEVETISGTLQVTEAGPDPARMIEAGTNVAVTLNPDRSYVLNGG